MPSIRTASPGNLLLGFTVLMLTKFLLYPVWTCLVSSYTCFLLFPKDAPLWSVSSTPPLQTLGRQLSLMEATLPPDLFSPAPSASPGRASAPGMQAIIFHWQQVNTSVAPSSFLSQLIYPLSWMWRKSWQFHSRTEWVNFLTKKTNSALWSTNAPSSAPADTTWSVSFSLSLTKHTLAETWRVLVICSWGKKK